MEKNKGGRPREGTEVKRAPISMKTSPELRARIEGAAKASGLSMAQEVERRLLQSFDEEGRYGGPATAAFLQATARAIGVVEARMEADWLSDYATWHAAQRMVERQLKNWRPTPPNAPAIAAAMQARNAAVASFSKAFSHYEDSFRRPEPAKNNALAGLQTKTPTARLPSEALNDEEAVLMNEAWDAVQIADDKMKECEAELEAAFVEADTQRAAGQAVADTVLNEVERLLDLRR